MVFLLFSLLLAPGKLFAKLPTELQPAFAAFEALSRKYPEIQSLLNSAIQKTGAETPAKFFEQIHTCTDGLEEKVGGIRRRSESLKVYVARELEELFVASGKSPKIQDAYLSKARAAFGEKIPASALLISTVHPDLVEYEERRISHEICIKSGTTPEASAISLAHELVHVARSTEAKPKDPLEFGGPDDYAMKTALSEGDEVDAFIVELGLKIKTSGPSSLDPEMRRWFSSSGTFTGSREEFAQYILDHYNYRELRFTPEYARLLSAAAQNEARLRNTLLLLVRLRSKQEMLLERKIAILRASGDLSQAEHQIALLRVARESRERAEKEAKESETRQKLLMARSKRTAR